MLTESFGRATTENHSGRDKQVPAVKDCRFTQTAFGTVVHRILWKLLSCRLQL